MTLVKQINNGKEFEVTKAFPSSFAMVHKSNIANRSDYLTKKIAHAIRTKDGKVKYTKGLYLGKNPKDSVVMLFVASEERPDDLTDFVSEHPVLKMPEMLAYISQCLEFIPGYIRTGYKLATRATGYHIRFEKIADLQVGGLTEPSAKYVEVILLQPEDPVKLNESIDLSK